MMQILYILCYMCIWMIIAICELHMQGLMGKQGNSGILAASLPCICTRQRKKHTAKAFFAVHTHTAHGKGLLCRAHTHGKEPPAVHCAAPCVLVCFFAVRGVGEAHGKADPVPCGLEAERTAKIAARQPFQPHGKEICTAKQGQRTAKHGCTAKAFAVPLARGARQSRLCRAGRCRAVFAVQARTAKALPS
jgi:hypothetical protein